MKKTTLFNFVVDNVGSVALMGFGLIMLINFLNEMFSPRHNSDGVLISLVAVIICGFCLIAGYKKLYNKFQNEQKGLVKESNVNENNDPFKFSVPISEPKKDGIYFGIVVSKQLPAIPIGLILVFKRNRVFKYLVSPKELQFYTVEKNQISLFKELTESGLFRHKMAFTGLCQIEGAQTFRISFNDDCESFHGVGLTYNNGIDFQFVIINNEGENTLTASSPMFYKRCV